MCIFLAFAPLRLQEGDLHPYTFLLFQHISPLGIVWLAAELFCSTPTTNQSIEPDASSHSLDSNACSVVSEQFQIHLQHLDPSVTTAHLDNLFFLENPQGGNEKDHTEQRRKQVEKQETECSGCSWWGLFKNGLLKFFQKPEKAALTDAYKAGITDTFLKDYKPLRIWKTNIQFTWFGFYKLYRMTLVIFFTQIGEPVRKLSTMTVWIVFMTVIFCIVRPFKNEHINITVMLSYTATIFIAGVNLVKGTVERFRCTTHCLDVTYFVGSLVNAEWIFLVFVPTVSVLLWVILKLVEVRRK